MDLGLGGKVVLVCGGSRGIGFAAAEEFVREGASVAICARDAAALEQARKRLAAAGPAPHPVAADLASTAGLATAIADVGRWRDHVDILITNTGGPPTATALGAEWSAWQQASELLLRSAVELTRAFVPGMQARSWGRVIGITSLVVKQPAASLVLSNSLRAAVTGYYRTLANEVAADGVTVNTVLPGYTATERLDDLADATTRRTGATRDAVFAGWVADSPVRRLGTPGEIAAVIAFLASDRASFVTGQAICVDGGAVKALM